MLWTHWIYVVKLSLLEVVAAIVVLAKTVRVVPTWTIYTTPEHSSCEAQLLLKLRVGVNVGVCFGALDE